MTLSNYLSNLRQLIAERLNLLVPEKETHNRQLFKAARYSLLSGGKRLRPILTCSVAEAFGQTIDRALNPACAIEMIHIYSLIHDDLPCMDNDDLRRGLPTLHKVVPEGEALLAGDFLLTYAFQIIAEDPLIDANQKIQMITTLTRRIGGEGMIGGQAIDLASEGKKIDLETLQLMHQLKTGDLITASLEFGGIISNVSKENMRLLRQFGQNIGLAYQVIDDILDHSTESDSTKPTYVTLMGLEASKEYADRLLNSAIKAIKQLPVDTSKLQELALLFVHRSF